MNTNLQASSKSVRELVELYTTDEFLATAFCHGYKWAAQDTDGSNQIKLYKVCPTSMVSEDTDEYGFPTVIWTETTDEKALVVECTLVVGFPLAVGYLVEDFCEEI